MFLSPVVVAPAAFCSTSVARLTDSSAESDSRLTIDVAVTEVGVVSVALWRPVTSAMPDGLTAILPTSSGALSFHRGGVVTRTVAGLRVVRWGVSVGGRNSDALPGDNGCADAEGYCQPTDPTDITRSVHCCLLTT